MNKKALPTIVFVGSRKGGVGKTTITLALGRYFAKAKSSNVIAIDADLTGTEATELVHPVPPGQDASPERWPLSLLDVLSSSVGGHQVAGTWLEKRVTDSLAQLPEAGMYSKGCLRLLPSHRSRDPVERTKQSAGLAMRAAIDRYNRIHVKSRLASLLAVLLSATKTSLIVVDLTPFDIALTEVSRELVREAAGTQEDAPPGVLKEHWLILKQVTWRWLDVISPDPQDLVPAVISWLHEAKQQKTPGWYRACINRDLYAAKSPPDQRLAVREVAGAPMKWPRHGYLSFLSGPVTSEHFSSGYKNWTGDLMDWLDILSDKLRSDEGNQIQWADFLK